MRRYDVSSLNPKGFAEDMACCISEVSDHTGWHTYQCSRKRGHGPDGLYCKQHGEMEAKGMRTRPADIRP